jgi:hypothetical protein
LYASGFCDRAGYSAHYDAEPDGLSLTPKLGPFLWRRAFGCIPMRSGEGRGAGSGRRVFWRQRNARGARRFYDGSGGTGKPAVADGH